MFNMGLATRNPNSSWSSMLYCFFETNLQLWSPRVTHSPNGAIVPFFSRASMGLFFVLDSLGPNGSLSSPLLFSCLRGSLSNLFGLSFEVQRNQALKIST